MSVYVMSDLHGMSLDELKSLLNKADFCEDDFLYILGDVIDRRGDGGVAILRWLMTQPNAQLILGNHEAMLLSCSFLFEEITEESISALNSEKISLLDTYRENGGDVTLKALNNLDKNTVLDILDYLRDCPIYETVTAGNKDFILVHSGLKNFDKNKKLCDYTADELLWAWPKYDDEYFEDITTVFGHTPTIYYDRESKGKILYRPTWIDIDVGTSYGYGTAMLRLDDLKEFYI
ncbi:MAG: metallophosphoesterase [Clostridia bacterium]|nr:metallophosphoesterase [Clostridia bacterium]